MSGDTAAPGRWRNLKRGALLGFVALVLGALVALLWATFERYDGDPRELVAGSADLQGDRDRVMRQARSFMVRMNTYGPEELDEGGKTMPGYRDELLSMVSDKFGSDFETNGAPLAEATVSQQGLARTAEVYAVGVKRLDEDSAVALVAGSFTNSYPETPGSETRVTLDPQPFRVRVALIETDGKWLVDSFEPVASQAGQGGTPDLPGAETPGGETEGGTP